MRISTNWINDYVDIKVLDKKDLAERITNAGVNIEKIETSNLNNLVIGKVISCLPHPDSDHLHICEVDVKDEILPIVCGAPNVREGLKVIVAKVGAVLPGNFKIEERVVRGATSRGMICALYELGLEEKTEENYQKGIYEVEDQVEIGTNALTYLGCDDTIYELDLNPNRNDCLSHIGFAYEVASVLNKKVILQDNRVEMGEDNIENYLSLNVETPRCKLYQAKMVTNIKVGPSPMFIQNRLKAVGMNPINNVVDISNYVMLEYGQPLHFFDQKKLKDKIIVRDAKNGEIAITLDNEEKILTSDDVIITDTEKIVALAGVKGCANSGIDENTTSVVIESALFDPYYLRYTSIRHNLRSEASLRGEKPLNYEYVKDALDRACYLLAKYAGGTILQGKLIHDKIEKRPKVASVTLDKVTRMLGIEISKEEIDRIFDQLGFSYQFEDGTYLVTIPNRRMDVAITEDLVEEIGRIYGYDKLITKLPKETIKPGKYVKSAKFRKDTSKRMRASGLNEVRTYTLTSDSDAIVFDEDTIEILLPMSQDKKKVRTSLIPSLNHVFEYNNTRGINDVAIYEIANIYKHENYEEETKLCMLISGNIINNWNQKIKVNFYILKGIVEDYLNYMGYENRIEFQKTTHEIFHPYRTAKILIDHEEIGIIGQLHPNYQEKEVYVCELSLTKLQNKKRKKIKYQEVSKYPEIKKDVAFIFDKDIEVSKIIKTIEKKGTKLLRQVEVFDLYKIDENKKSLAFNLIFASLERTLTEKEVMEIFHSIIETVTKEYQAELRDHSLEK